MPIVISSDATRLLDSGIDPLGIQLLTESAHEAVAGALDTALTRLRKDHPSLGTSGVVLVPGGPLIQVRGLSTRHEGADDVIETLIGSLEADGVDAVLQIRDTFGLSKLDTVPNAVILRAFPPPDSPRVPTHWVDLAGDWLAGDLESDTKVPLRVLGVGFEVPAATAPGVLHQSAASGTWCDAYSGDLDTRVRTASLSFGRAPHIALGIGGPTIDSNGLLSRFDLLCEAALEFAPDAAYVCVDLEPSFAGLAAGMLASWPAQGGAPAHLVAGRLADVAVPDSFPFQILGPGHRERMGPVFDDLDPELIEQLAGGKWSFSSADPAEWLPIHDIHDLVQADHRELLTPLLLGADDIIDLLGEDSASSEMSDGLLTTGPSLDEIVLESTTHPRRGTRLTLLELAAWLSQSRHSDAPPGVSTVLMSFGRLFAQGLDDVTRQQLSRFAPSLVGTADPETIPRRLGPNDKIRAWAACEWTVKVQAVGWLRAAGLTDRADLLEASGPLDDRKELLRVIDQLGHAATTAGRRIDITLDIAGRSPEETDELDALAWSVWERASEESAWVAASEAASRGISNDLLYATDLRVIECARDAQIRDELTERNISLGDQAWTAAVSEVAAEAWRDGWRVAAERVYEQSTFSLDTATERTLDAVSDKLGLEPDIVESRYVAGEEAARASLATSVLDGGRDPEGLSAWDDACRAARSVHGGEAWGLTFDGAADAVGRDTHSEAMAVARDRVEDLLIDAPDAVARTVTVAVAREAAAASARGIAVRAAAIASAHGADDSEIENRARESLRPTVEKLRDAAFELFDQMVQAAPQPRR